MKRRHALASCCVPRLRSVPVGDWYCAACTTRSQGQPRPAPNLQSQPPSRRFSVQNSAAGQLPGTPSTISMLATQEAGGGSAASAFRVPNPIESPIIGYWDATARLEIEGRNAVGTGEGSNERLVAWLSARCPNFNPTKTVPWHIRSLTCAPPVGRNPMITEGFYLWQMCRWGQ